MVIALLAVIGVDLIVIVILVGGLIARRRWVRDVFVFTKAPVFVRNVLIATDHPYTEWEVEPDDKLKRLGDHPIVATINCDGAVLEIAAGAEHSALLRGPHPEKEHA